MLPYVRIGLAALALLAAGGVGYGLGSWRGAVRETKLVERQLESSQATVRHQDAAIERHNRELASERARFAADQAARDRQRAVAQGVVDEIAADADLGCEWRDAHRLRIDRLYRAYGYQQGSPAGVPDSMPIAAKPGAPP